MLQQSRVAAQRDLQILVFSHFKQDGFPHTHTNGPFLKLDYNTQKYFINKILVSTQHRLDFYFH